MIYDITKMHLLHWSTNERFLSLLASGNCLIYISLNHNYLFDTCKTGGSKSRPCVLPCIACFYYLLNSVGFLTYTMAKNESKSPVIGLCTIADGLKINSVELAEHLIPSKFEDSKLVAKPANELFKCSADSSFKDMVPALGSTENVYSFGNCGLFSAIITSYNYHWKLRTSPDDWWFCVIKQVACAIDKNAEKESVRKMFVDHEGKKTIEVVVPDTSIYTVDYSWFFDQMAKRMQENVKVPEFVDGMTADFSTTTAVQKIVSQITLMYSVKEYFQYKMVLACGIPAVEMLGTEDDWSKLQSKLKVLRTLLEPIENDLGLSSEWWDLVEKVFRELLATYQGRPDKEWWSHIISYEESFGSGGQKRYRGWITDYLEGTNQLVDIDDMTTGLVSVPLVLEDPVRCVKDDATLVAGMLGFTVHTDDTKQISVQPFQGWSLLLSKDSPFLK